MSGSILSNLLKGVVKKTTRFFANPYKSVGISSLELRRLKNLPDKKLHTAPFLGRRISFISRDEFIHSIQEIFLEKIYLQQLPRNAFVIDCGANIGLSVIYIKSIEPSAHIIAFEPDETNFNLLKANTQSFQLNDIDVRQEAIWIDNSTITFQSEGSLMSRIAESPDKGEAIQVKATRLADLIDRKVDFLKIDIEGAEYRVIKDIAAKLDFVQSLFLEYHGKFEQNNELNEILLIISNAGFNYYIKHAIEKHPTPFQRTATLDYDVQLNIFCFRPTSST